LNDRTTAPTTLSVTITAAAAGRVEGRGEHTRPVKCWGNVNYMDQAVPMSWSRMSENWQ